MSSTQFAFGAVKSNSTRTNAMAMIASSITSETKTPSGSTASTTAVAADPGGGYLPVCRVATDTQVKVSFGTAPNAGTDATAVLLPAGAVEYFIVAVGDKGAVITA